MYSINNNYYYLLYFIYFLRFHTFQRSIILTKNNNQIDTDKLSNTRAISIALAVR